MLGSEGQQTQGDHCSQRAEHLWLTKKMALLLHEKCSAECSVDKKCSGKQFLKCKSSVMLVCRTPATRDVYSSGRPGGSMGQILPGATWQGMAPQPPPLPLPRVTLHLSQQCPPRLRIQAMPTNLYLEGASAAFSNTNRAASCHWGYFLLSPFFKGGKKGGGSSKPW